MKWATLSAILFSITVQAQTVLPNAKATETRYINVPKFDYQTNGHPYTVGVTLGAALTDPAYITKIDIVTRQVTTKLLPGAYSHLGAYWNGTYDSLGRLYIPWATDNYHVFKTVPLRLPIQQGWELISTCILVQKATRM